MVVGAKPRCFGMRLENGRFSDPTYCKSQEASLHGEGEPTDCTIKAEEIRRS
jgi:hypothetical protein